jgi:hypothetical protein
MLRDRSVHTGTQHAHVYDACYLDMHTTFTTAQEGHEPTPATTCDAVDMSPIIT